MNKNQGLLAGAVLALAMLLRPAGVNIAPSNSTNELSPTLPAAFATSKKETTKESDGPWLASCAYWAPVRPPEDVQVQTTEPLDKIADAIRGLTEQPRDPGCGPDAKERWGFPTAVNPPEGNHPIEIKTIIATVPDPVHTHLAMAFDRSIDVLLQAASDNGYISSYYWLPWRNNSGQIKAAEMIGGREAGHDALREREPGLIVLKTVPSRPSEASWEDFSQHSFYKLVYLFLVAETPTEGIDGDQFRRAVAYESSLNGILIARGNVPGDQVEEGPILGPYYSGSAAGLRAAIDAARTNGELKLDRVQVLGATVTQLSLNQLMQGTSPIDYFSFQSHFSHDQTSFQALVMGSGTEQNRIAVLSEDDSALGKVSFRTDKTPDILAVKFPREISLLRNTQVDAGQIGGNAPNGSIPSPYLHFSVKDSSAQDAVPKFSREHTPLSQESQLMMIARELRHRRIKVAVISASDELDEIFLAQFLRRACPDVRLAFLQNDVLMVRDVDDEPFVGSIAVGPYSFVMMGGVTRSEVRAYTDTHSEGYYNAASFALWDQDSSPVPLLQGYRSTAPLPNESASTPRQEIQPTSNNEVPRDLDIPPLLWTTAIGSDGYYPLAIANPCPSFIFDPRFPNDRDYGRFLPIFRNGSLQPEDCNPLAMNQRIGEFVERAMEAKSGKRALPTFPSLAWDAVSWVIVLGCLSHGVILLLAKHGSPFGQDLAIANCSRPARRSLFVNVGTAALWSMAVVVSLPMIILACFEPVRMDSLNTALSFTILASGLFAAVMSLVMTRKYLRRDRGEVADGCAACQFVVGIAAIALPVSWAYICMNDNHRGDAYHVFNNARYSYHDLAGLSFSYRCLHPGSGVSPVVPVLLLLLGWYVWALIQTWRLRVMGEARPVLPHSIKDGCESAWFVADEDIDRVGKLGRFSLIENMDSFQIAGRIAGQVVKKPWMTSNASILLFYSAGLICLALFGPVSSLDHFLWSTPRFVSNPYELLVGMLLFPLVYLAFAGWLRLLFIWSSLKAGMLERLEDMPIRFAFSRLRRAGWMAILSRVGPHEQRRDLERSLESVRMFLHLPHNPNYLPEGGWKQLEDAMEAMRGAVDRFHECPIGNPQGTLGKAGTSAIQQIEEGLSGYGQLLLKYLLIPYWRWARVGLVESGEAGEMPIKARRGEALENHPHVPMELHAGPSMDEPALILAAEEFLAIRYMALIRSALGNMSYLVTFISIAFALSIIAWNSYPFQPRQLVDWVFTITLSVFSAGVIWVFAQMHRDPILSRVTNTKPNELGWDFYFRIISFGAVPVLTWIAYEFPDIGASIYKIFQPASSVFR